MVSDEPRENRCGATVTTSVGLEVTDRETDTVYSSEDGLGSVVLERDEEDITVEEECDPEMTEIRKYVLSDGFRVARVMVDDEWVEIEDDDARIGHVTTEFDGYCERYQMDNGRCYVHGGASDDMENNTRAMTHGLKAKRSNYYREMDEEDKVEVEMLVESWLEDAPFGEDNRAKVNELYRIAVDQIRLWNAQDEFDKGIVFDQYEDMGPEGDEIYTPKENPANLPYDRLDRTTYRKLKDLGLLSSPEDKQAEATQSLADKFADLHD